MATIQVELVPFKVPDRVFVKMGPGRRQDGIMPNPGLPLSDLDPEALSHLCDEFRSAIFQLAGKNDPRVEFKSTGPGVTC